MASVWSFNDYLNEASIVNQTDYLPGHKVELSKRAKKEYADALKGNIELAEPTDDAQEIGSGNAFVYVKAGGKTYKVLGTKSGIENSFNHAGGGKSDTHKKTRCKEAISLILFKAAHDGKEVSEEEAIDMLPDYGAEQSVYNTNYYIGAKLQTQNFKRIKPIRGKKLIFEFQGDKYSKKIYNKKRELGGPSNDDNWNPADVWLFESSFAGRLDAELGDITTLNELNFWLRKSFLTGLICPISLKLPDKKSKMELINPLKYKNKKLDYDFSLDRMVIAGSLKSCFIETKSGYTFKANARAGKNNPNLYLEGTFKGENFAMGAIDAKLWDDYHNGSVLIGNQIKPDNRLLEKSKRVFNKYKRNILQKDNDILFNPDFKEMDTLLQQRYIAVATLVRFVMTNYEDTIRWSFFTAMKVSDTNSMYIKIK